MSDTKSKAQAIKTSRRTFLLAVGAGGAATAAAIAIAAKVAPQQRVSAGPAQDKKSGKGYQETAHIRSYYRTTEV